MSRTVLDLHTSLAYRLGENSAPSDATEKAKRLSWFNEGYRDLMKREFWWFSRKTDTESTVEDQQAYSMPADFRKFIEMRVDDYLYSEIPYDEVYSKLDSPSRIVSLPQYSEPNRFYIKASSYYLDPTPSADGTDNIDLYYYYFPTALTSDSDVTIIPDLYVDLLVAYAEGRYWSSITQRGKASDGFSEFEQIVSQMTRENNSQYLGVANRTLHPDDIPV